MPLLRSALAMGARLWAATVAGLWAATLLPGVDLSDGSLGRKTGSLLGAAAVSCLVWWLPEPVLRLFTLVKRRIGLSASITTTHSLAFPAFTAQAEFEISGPAVDGLGRVLRRVLRAAAALLIFPLQFWVTGWLAARSGLGFTVTGFWPVVVGSLITNVVYVSVASVKLERQPAA